MYILKHIYYYYPEFPEKLENTRTESTFVQDKVILSKNKQHV